MEATVYPDFDRNFALNSHFPGVNYFHSDIGGLPIYTDPGEHDPAHGRSPCRAQRYIMYLTSMYRLCRSSDLFPADCPCFSLCIEKQIGNGRLPDICSAEDHSCHPRHNFGSGWCTLPGAYGVLSPFDYSPVTV